MAATESPTPEVAPDPVPPGHVKVTVAAPFQVCWLGVVFLPGDGLDVPQHVADDWRRAGWVD